MESSHYTRILVPYPATMAKKQFVAHASTQSNNSIVTRLLQHSKQQAPTSKVATKKVLSSTFAPT